MDEKREKLLDAASKVFAAEGYHKAKITKIAEIAGVGAGTVYLYFKNKENILEELFIISWSRIDAKLRTLIDDLSITPQLKITYAVGEIVDMVHNRADVAKMVLHEYSFWSAGPSERVNKVVDSAKNSLAEIIRSGIKSGNFKIDLVPENVTIFIIGGIWNLLAYLSNDFTNTDVNVLKMEIERIIFNGLNFSA